MRVLVAVASKHGSTREIAEAVAAGLRARGLDVDFYDAGNIHSVAGYDAVVLGSAIYAGNWLVEAKGFAEAFRAELAKVPLWLFSSGPLGAENPQPQDDPNRLVASLGDVIPRDHRVFVGKLDPETLGFAERLIAKAVHAPSGDFRDWDAIRDWAQSIASELLRERTV